MATELYGISAQIVDSLGTIGVSTNTNLYFIGTAPSGELNTPIVITSLEEAETVLGLDDDHKAFSLYDAVQAAFVVAGLRSITCIVASNSSNVSSAVIVGDADAGTGIYAYVQALRDAPTVTNLLCVPRQYNEDILAALAAVCQNAEDLMTYAVVDMSVDPSQISESGYPIPSVIVTDKEANSSYMSVVWGSVKTIGDDVISGAAVRACLMAKADASYNAPARVGGNLTMSNVKAIGMGTVDASSGTETWTPFKMTKAIANSLSADGICTFRSKAGRFFTWGDHTSAFAGGTISDELGRFENRMRMQQMICNRFVLKYEPEVDEPLTLSMRNDIINEELDYLNLLVARGALIGEQSVEFKETSNPIDNIIQGQFVFDIATTETNPFKYGLARVAFSTRGLSAYTQG